MRSPEFEPGLLTETTICYRQYDDAEEEYQEAEAALEEMDDAEAEEREVEEVEDLLEYYLQRAANTQAEAERLLEGARDLEESIGVSLSARRFEVSFSHKPNLPPPFPSLIPSVLSSSHAFQKKWHNLSGLGL